MHPVSIAITNAVEGLAVRFKNIEEHAGKGLKGEFEEQTACLGSADFLKMLGIKSFDQAFSQSDATTVYFAIDGIFKTELLLGDQIRPEISELLLLLKPAKTVLLSGDSENVVAKVAKRCGFEQWKSQCSPLEKRDFIDGLRRQNQIVCMIGDGINDAPALTAAQIGVSVVSATDISIQVSDVLLTTDRLSVIPKIRNLALKGQKIVRQNLFWAFFYNALGLALAAGGLLSPIFAAFAMIASSLMVLLNSMRCK
jgi:P-type E1-E2 ATPase